MGTRRVLVGLLIVLSCSIFTFGCEMPTDADKTSIWLDVPVDGITVPEGQLLKIEGHASSPNAISKVEIWINGELRYEVDNPTTQGKLTRFSQEWTPPKPGEYTIQVMALSEDGSASDPDHARVLVGEPLADIQTAPEEEQSLQEEAPDTPTPTATPVWVAPARLEPLNDFSTEDMARFRWIDSGPLPSGVYYEVVIWREGENPTEARGIAAAVRDTQLNVHFAAVSHVTRGSYYWTVILVRTGPPYQRLTQPVEGWRVYVSKK